MNYENRRETTIIERLAEAMRENPRELGEDVCAYLERVNVAAGLMILSQCQELERDELVIPVRSREPGEDG